MIQRWSEWWRRFWNLPDNSFQQAINILLQRYVEETQQLTHLTNTPTRCIIPSFEENSSRYRMTKPTVDRLAEAIVAVRGKLPSVPELRSTDETVGNS